MSGKRTLIPSADLVDVPMQPQDGLHNGCWVSPVVAVAKFYGVVQLPAMSRSERTWPKAAGNCEITVASVLALRPGDEEEDAFDVLEDIMGSWLPEATYGNDEEIQKEEEVVWGGPTSKSDYGTQVVSDSWFAAVTTTIRSDNLILLLVERLEGGKDKGNTHYLVVLGYEESKIRRSTVRKLWLKDPMVSPLPPAPRINRLL